MFSRILALTLCLALLVPACKPEDRTSCPPQVEESQRMSTAKERPTGDAAAGEPREKEAATESAAAPAAGSPAALSQAEESSLSARAEEPGPEVAGGALSNLHLTYAVIALAAIILVLLIK